jgi:hypothetical protein
MADPNLFVEYLVNKSKAKFPSKSEPSHQYTSSIQKSNIQGICQIFEDKCKNNTIVMNNIDTFAKFMDEHIPTLFAKFEKTYIRKVD